MILCALLLCVLPLVDQLNAHKYYGEKCIPDSEILLPYGRCFCDRRRFVDLCVGLFEREDVVMRSEPEEKNIGCIVGGHSVPISRHPYVVGFERDGKLSCGATIIGADWVITAAHCFDGILGKFKCIPKVECQVRAGSSKSEREGDLFDMIQILVHEDYNRFRRNNANDLAVVKVNKPFREVNKKLITVKLPKRYYEIPVGKMVTVIGWGLTQEKGKIADDLQEIKIPVVDNDSCRSVYGSIITSRMICAGYPEGKIDTCQADSGGPMLIKRTLVGLLSFGAGCARPDHPGVYTKVASFRDWIKNKTGV